MKKLILFITLAATITCCSTDTDFLSMDKIMPQNAPLKITTRILSTESLSFVQEFTKGSVIGIHVTHGNAGDLYKNDIRYKNIRVEAASITNRRIDWQQTPITYLNTQPATIYAYYPYQSQTNFNPASIPVHISPDAHATNDYMYGTHARGQKAVNNVSPTILLTMKHALSLITFRVSLARGTVGTFTLSAVQLGNKAGCNTLFSKGTMDITSGVVIRETDTNGSTLLTLNDPVVLDTQSVSPLQLMVIPTDKPIGEGEVEALFTINSSTYKFTIPTKTSWDKGQRYMYHLCFNGKSLHLNKVSISTWIPENKENNLSCN